MVAFTADERTPTDSTRPSVVRAVKTRGSAARQCVRRYVSRARHGLPLARDRRQRCRRYRPIKQGLPRPKLPRQRWRPRHEFGLVCLSANRGGVLPGRLPVVKIGRGSTDDCEVDGTVDSGCLRVAGRGPEGATHEVLASEVSGFATMAGHSLAREANCLHVASRDHLPSCECVRFGPIRPLSGGLGRRSHSPVGGLRSDS